MNLKILAPQFVPANLEAGLTSLKLIYTNPVSIFHLIQLYPSFFCGVFGDGDNASYEWFHLAQGKVSTSNQGFGDSSIALLRGLEKAYSE